MFKKSLLLTLLLALLVPWAAMAQTPSVTIGSGTATSAYLPTRSYNKYTISQQIYTAEEINASGTITSISFYRTDANTGANNARKFDIYMAHTTKSEFTSSSDWAALTDADIVYHGTTAIAQPQNQWYAFTLDTPFEYNGTDNLIVVVIDRSGAYSSYNADNTYRVFSTVSSYQAMYATNDNYTSLNPNGTNNTSSLSGSRSTSKNQIVLGGIQQTCAKPTNLTATLDDTDHTIATLSWTENGQATSWVLQYSEDNTFTTGVQSFNISGTPSKDLTGLTPEHTYYARVRPDCNENLWSDVCEFKPSASFCDDIGTGSSAANLVFTSYGCTYSQHIYTADDLTNMGFSAGDIVSVSFFYSGASSTLSKTQSIYMGTTTKSSYSGYTASDFESEVTLVYGPELLSYVAGWREYELTEPFTWDGTSNIVVGMLTNATNGSSSGWSTDGTSTSPDYLSIYRYQDNNPIDITNLASVSYGNRSQIRPNMHLCIAPSTKPHNLTVSNITSTGATLTWQAPVGSTPTGYEYQYKTSTGEWPTDWTSNGTNLSVSLNGQLTSSTPYNFRVRATYAEGESDPVETTFTTLDACAFPTNFVATITPGQGTKATLTWVKGYDEEAWVLQYATNNAFTEGLVEMTDGFTVEGNNVTANLTGLTAETKYYARVKANCDGPTSAWSDVADFTPTNYVDFTYNETASSTNSNVPFYYYTTYSTNQSQFIIPTASLADVAGGSIRSITYYTSSTATLDFGGAEFDVYMAEVEQASFSSATFVDWTTLGTPVYSGTVSLANSKMTITFDDNFSYSGGNLLIGFKNTKTESNSTSFSWTAVYNSSSYTQVYQYGANDANRTYYQPKVTLNYRPTSTPRPIITEPVATTDVTATIAWTKPSDDVTGYKYQYKLAANSWTDDWTTLNDANAVSVTIPGLTPNSSYDFRMKAVYAAGESVISSTSFATECPVATPVTYTYGFETAPEFNCWEVTSSASNGVKRASSYAHEGDYSLVFYGTQLNEIEMPLFNQPTNTLRLEYWVRPEGYQDSRSGSFAIGYYNANDEFVALKTYEFNTTTGQYDNWESTTYIKQHIEFDVDANNDGTPDVPADAHIVFRQFNPTSNYYWMIDDVKVKVIPTCDDVENPVCTAATAHTATIGWTLLDNTQTAWQVAYSTEENFNPNSVTPVDVNTNPATIEDLAQISTYYAYVRANCGGGSYGDWSDTYATINTIAGNLPPTNLDKEGLTSDEVTITWEGVATNVNHVSYDLYYSTESTMPATPVAPNLITGINALSKTIDGLTPSTPYYVWVRDNCGTDGYSTWAGPLDFTTKATCPAPENLAVTPNSETAHGATITWEGTNDSYNMEYAEVPTATPIPILEADFEDGTMPTGWTTVSTGDNNWSVMSSVCDDYVDPYGNSDYAAGTPKGTSARTEVMYLITPTMDLSGMGSATLHFYYYSRSWSSDTDPFGVYYRIDGGDWQQLFYTTSGTSSWTEKNITLEGLAANYQIGFYRKDNFSYGVAIDDVLITATPTPSYAWAALENDVTSPYTITTLDPEKSYVVRVYGMCGSDVSEYSNIVAFTTTEACPAPVLSDPTSITVDEAELSWTGNSATYTVYYREVTDPVSAWSTKENITGNTTTITGLTDHTTYEAKVQGHCGTDGDSDESNVITFNTPCATTSIDVNNQLKESFDETEFAPGCWSIGDPVNTNKNWTRKTNKHHTGTASAHSGAYGPVYMYTPVVNIDGVEAQLSFWSYVDYKNWYTGGSNDAGGLNTVKVSTNGGSTWTQLWQPEIDDIATGWEQITLDLTAYVNQDIVIAFEYQGNNAHEWYVDDVRIAVVETFTKPINGYGTNDGGYYLIASPLADDTDPTTVTGMITDTYTGDDPAQRTYDLYAFDQNQDDEWRNYRKSASTFKLENGTGYLYASKENTDLTFTGVRYKGDGVVALVYTEGKEYAGWNLIGNPFTTAATLNKPFYKMNDDGDDFTAKIEDLNTTIAAMEGVFVQVTETNQSATFTPQTSKGGQQVIAHTNIVLSGDKGKVLDNAIIRFDNGETLEKFSLRDNTAKVYIPQDNKDYAVVSAEAYGELPVNFKAAENGTYTISFTTENVEFSYLHLIDNMKGNDVNLLENPSYSFDAQYTDFASRFKLVFAKNSGNMGDDFGFIDANGNLMVLGIEGVATLQVIDVTGRILSSETFSGNYSKSVNAAAGVYMLRLIQGNDSRTQKIVVK